MNDKLITSIHHLKVYWEDVSHFAEPWDPKHEGHLTFSAGYARYIRHHGRFVVVDIAINPKRRIAAQIYAAVEEAVTLGLVNYTGARTKTAIRQFSRRLCQRSRLHSVEVATYLPKTEESLIYFAKAKATVAETEDRSNGRRVFPGENEGFYCTGEAIPLDGKPPSKDIVIVYPAKPNSKGMAGRVKIETRFCEASLHGMGILSIADLATTWRKLFGFDDDANWTLKCETEENLWYALREGDHPLGHHPYILPTELEDSAMRAVEVAS